MNKIEFLIGDKKRFGEFIGGLSEKDKVALISHNDLDGLASAKVVEKVVGVDLMRFVGYPELNEEFVNWLKKNKINKAIFTDINLTKSEIVREIEKFAEVLIIDHHPPTADYNSNRTVFINAQGYCAAYICYYLFSKIQNLDGLDWLIAAASVSDWMYEKPKQWVEDVYQKYGDKFVMIAGGPKEGKFWDIIKTVSGALIYFKEDLRKVYDNIGEKFGDLGDLKKYADEVQKEIDESIDMFEKEKIEIKDGYFWELKSKFNIGSTVSTIVSTKYWEKIVIIGGIGEKYYKISAKRQDRKKDMAVLLKKLLEGFEDSSSGGHIPAAGGHILLKDVEEFKKRLKNM